jgi:hypothetical protein
MPVIMKKDFWHEGKKDGREEVMPGLTIYPFGT